MKIFSPLYNRVMAWARHPHAPWYLSGMSMAESIFFPVPVDVMLAPMALGQPTRAWHFALLATLGSLLGGIVGYALGYFLTDWVAMLLQNWGQQHSFEVAQSWFNEYGVWVVFIAGFSPIPYKVFTVSAGIMQMAFLPFVIASLIGRGMRFYLVAGLMKIGGAKMEQKLEQWVDWLGWGTVILAVVAYLALR